MLKRCITCSKVYQARRSTSRYCSDACRCAAYRARRRAAVRAAGSAPSEQLTGRPVGLGMVSQTLDGLKWAAVDLSRYGQSQSEPLAGKLERIASGVLESMRREGLL